MVGALLLSLFVLNNPTGPALCRSKVDGFVPHTQHVNLRKVPHAE